MLNGPAPPPPLNVDLHKLSTKALTCLGRSVRLRSSWPLGERGKKTDQQSGAGGDPHFGAAARERDAVVRGVESMDGK